MKRERSMSLEQDIQASHKRLCEIKRKQLAFDKRIRKYDAKISRLHKKKLKLTQQRTAFAHGPLENAIVPYAQACMRQLAAHMHTALPREIRDMIYGYFWDAQTFTSYLCEFDVIMDKACPGRPCQCLRFLKVPPILDPAFVGFHVAQESAEALYRAYPDKFLTTHRAESIESLLTRDYFHIGFEPAVMAREMNVVLHVDHYIRSAADDDDDGDEDKDKDDNHQDTEHESFTKRAVLEKCLRNLLKVSNKAGFKLHIELSMRYIRLRVLEEVLSIIKPIYDAFRSQDAHVDIVFTYQGRAHACRYHDHRVKKNLNDFFVSTPDEWRKELAKYLDEHEDEILDHHRDYLHEEDADYEPLPLCDYSSGQDQEEDDDFDEAQFGFSYHDYGYDDFHDDFHHYASDLDVNSHEMDFLFGMGLI